MIGAGYVGLVSAACFSEFGWTVTCIDKDPDKIAHLRQGGVPIYEPRLDELLHRNVGMGRITFSSELAPSVGDADPAATFLSTSAISICRPRRAPPGSAIPASGRVYHPS